MKKSILGASALMAAASAFAFVTWSGDESLYQITTELDAGTETSGYWFSYADDSDGGASSIEWPVPLGNDYSTTAMDPVIEYCQGVCGVYKLDKGTLTYDPFVGIGFNVAGEDDSGVAVPTDATDMGGICIGYSSDAAASLEMGLGDAGDAEIGWDNPAAALAKSATGKVANVAWSEFKQAGWGSGKITGAAAAAKLVALKMKIQAKTGSTGNFNIMSFGAYNGGCKLTTAISAKAAKASLKAQLSGRTLSFGKTVAKAEIVNLQGQVVMAASSVKSMDLSKVQAGVYMVRAEGLSQQIMVK